MAVPDPSREVMRRNRAKLLQRAAEMREIRVTPSSTGNWFDHLRRVAVGLAVLAIVFMSGTGLVRASSTTLPGDNLYPVKRTWENVSLLFAFDLTRRESLEVEHENERLEELSELLAEGRSAEVDFAGIITQQDGDRWLVSGITIVISPQTDLHDGPVFVGDAVRVFGVVQSDGFVLVERIDRLPPNAKLPDIGNSGPESEDDSNSGSGSNDNDNSGTSNANENDSSGSGSGNDNSNDNNSGPSGGNDNTNDNNSVSGSGNDNGNDNNSGSGSSTDDSIDDNSGSGSGIDNSNEDNSGSGGGDDNSNDDSSGSGGDD